MLPTVHAIGHVSRDASFKALSEKGGVVEFFLACKDDNPRAGDVDPVKRYKVDYWTKDGSAAAELTAGKPVYVEGKWVYRNDFHHLKAYKVQVISEE